MANHHILHYVPPIRVPVQFHTPEVLDGADAVVLHDRLGHRGSQHRIRPELHSFDHLARIARAIRSEQEIA